MCLLERRNVQKGGLILDMVFAARLPSPTVRTEAEASLQFAADSVREKLVCVPVASASLLGTCRQLMTENLTCGAV